MSTDNVEQMRSQMEAAMNAGNWDLSAALSQQIIDIERSEWSPAQEGLTREQFATADEAAVHLGAEVEQSINWKWANGFATEESAQQFLVYLDRYGYDHRGIYAPWGEETTWSVRFRR